MVKKTLKFSTKDYIIKKYMLPVKLATSLDILNNCYCLSFLVKKLNSIYSVHRILMHVEKLPEKYSSLAYETSSLSK